MYIRKYFLIVLMYRLPILYNLYVFLASTYFHARCLIALKFLQSIMKEENVHPPLIRLKTSFSKFQKLTLLNHSKTHGLRTPNEGIN